jgi:hypothetical protein
MTDRAILKLGFLVCLLLCVSSCQQVASQGTKRVSRASQKKAAEKIVARTDVYGPPSRLGVLAYTGIDESSGIAASRNAPGVYWTHNDSGDGPFIFAFDEHGAHKGVWRVTGATARDWEDIAAGPGPELGTNYLYIGDIGDNTETRSEEIVYRIPEPVITPGDASSTKKNPVSTTGLETIRLRYPDGKHDSEALLVHPVTGNIYLVTKTPFGNPVIYEAQTPLDTGATNTMVRVAEIQTPSIFGGLITGGDISPDGLRVALCDYGQGYELVLPDSGTPFNQIWKQTLNTIDLGKRKQGEAIAYRLDGKALLMTSEGLPTPLLQVERR